MRVQTDGGKLVIDKAGTVREGHVDRFRRVAVLLSEKGKQRFYLLEPAIKEDRLELGKFVVYGHFKVAKHVGQSDAARTEWKQVGADREEAS